ncbi:hypothetical protein H2200_001500 [Cladophialophora chaetospira]|uniref:Aldehyde dehydrogenase domain-containing protein n=1 Tax=Cladophialophora chaetospira TaxID=386627 RepID=A0AA38XLS5_9EURO|nr:hypothetical protein H2200_001500 [Cladophialophora chaetospira]
MASNGTKYHTVEDVPLWIDNEAVHSANKFEVKNSSTQEVQWTASGADVDLAKRAVGSASRAFVPWSRTHPTQRRRIFLKAAELFRSRRAELVDVMVRETNCTRQWADEVNMTIGINFLDELASLATWCSTGSLPTTESADRLAMVFKQPYGVILGIAPWNSAFILAIRAVATPILCGNTAILKASELSPKTHHLIAQIFRDAGLPPGVLNVVQHSREDAAEVINTMIGHPAVRKINFTGSTAVGRIIAREAGQHLKPVLLELGGKSSCVVLDDADLTKAARAVASGAFINHGQVCMGTERVMVQRSVAQDFRAALRKEAQKVSQGNAVTVTGAQRSQSLVAKALEQGAQLEYGQSSLKGAAQEPTVISGVTEDMEIFYAESFGPTVTLTEVDTAEEAVALANDTDYGLSASIFSKDISRAIRYAKQIETGACHINAGTVHDEPTLPHGGNNSSGYGRFGAQWGMDEFLQIKTITVLDDAAD